VRYRTYCRSCFEQEKTPSILGYLIIGFFAAPRRTSQKSGCIGFCAGAILLDTLIVTIVVGGVQSRNRTSNYRQTLAHGLVLAHQRARSPGNEDKSILTGTAS
jgi:hypothetical protein